MTDAQVQWSLLPHRPREFFGLASDFDRRELKRAYGKLIRRYRPETNPNEFQRIRGAYEQLETGLRYRSTVDRKWDVLRKPIDQPDSSSQKNAQPAAPVEQPSESPEDQYRQLIEKVGRSPKDFFQLAVLSDVVCIGEANEESFESWLIKGLSEFPGNLPLQTLLREYSQTQTDLHFASPFLQESARELSDSDYFSVTEAIWCRLVRELDFEQVQRLLDQCNETLSASDSASKDAFQIRFLRHAIWFAPKDWINQSLDKLSNNAAALDDALQSELDFLLLIRVYLFGSNYSNANTPILVKVKEFLRFYCIADRRTESSELLAMIDELARNEQGIRGEFEVFDAQEHQAFLFPFLVATEELHRELGLPTHHQENEVEHHANILRKEISNTSLPMDLIAIAQKFRYAYPAFFTIGWAVLSIVLVYLPVSSQGIGARSSYREWGIGLSILSILIFALASWFLIYPQFWSRQAAQEKIESAAESYNRRFRDRFFRYVRSCGEDHITAIGRLAHPSQSPGMRDALDHLAYCADNDTAFQIYAQLQRFQFRTASSRDANSSRDAMDFSET